MPAGVVQGRRQPGQLHEITEILDRAVAPAFVQVAHEGRTVDRREHRMVAADFHRAFRVAGILGELRRRRGAELAGEGRAGSGTRVSRTSAPASRNIARHSGSSWNSMPTSSRNGIGIVLDQLQPFGREQFDLRNFPLNSAQLLDRPRPSAPHAGFPARRQIVRPAGPPGPSPRFLPRSSLMAGPSALCAGMSGNVMIRP